MESTIMCNGEYNGSMERTVVHCITESALMCNGEYNGSMERTVVHYNV